MALLYLDSCCGLNLLVAQNGEVYLHHLMENTLIGPLESADDARMIILQILN